MIKFDVLNRFSGEIQFTAEIDCADSEPHSWKLRLAVQWAIKTGADLSDTDLSGADLSDTDLCGADLSGAKLRRAKLSGADLCDTDLSGADLSGAKLRRAKEDFLREVLKMPGELEFLRDAIRNGKINGSVYEGECACLAGTLSKATGKSWSIFKDDSPIAIDASSPRERFFMGIAEGDTPETNPISAIALEWTNKAISIRDSKKETNQ